MTRRELDEMLARLEARVQHLLVELPQILRDVHDVRALLAAPGQTPTSATAEDLPEQPEGGQAT